MSRAFDKIKAGLDEALDVARGDTTAIARIRVTPSCGCVFCDLKVALYRDDHGFYHTGPEDTRIVCEAPIEGDE
ncbi:hypothetical protein [Bradyrhizobium sp. S3.7.6]